MEEVIIKIIAEIQADNMENKVAPEHVLLQIELRCEAKGITKHEFKKEKMERDVSVISARLVSREGLLHTNDQQSPRQILSLSL